MTTKTYSFATKSKSGIIKHYRFIDLFTLTVVNYGVIGI
jgi:hypothetical protein